MLDLPQAIAVAADGTVYVADVQNYRVRRIRPDTVIDTVAGNGEYDALPDGGDFVPRPATSVPLGWVVALALDSSGTRLYVAETDSNHNRVRRVDLTSGTLDWEFYGVTSPLGLAVDAVGGTLVSSTVTCDVVRIVPGSGTSRIVGTGNVPTGCTPGGGDGGAATDATIWPTRLARDAAGNLFILDGGGIPDQARVRRVDATTGVITTVAGGGATEPGTGPAIEMDLDGGGPGVVVAVTQDVAVDATPGGATRLFIATDVQVYLVDLATGTLSVLAGVPGPSNGYGGDGGPPLDAQFNGILGVASGPAGVVVGDSANHRVRRIALAPVIPACEISFIGTNLTSITAPGVTHVAGCVDIIDNDAATDIDLGQVLDIGGDLQIVGNDSAQTIDLSELQNVGGDLTVIGNDDATDIDLGLVQNVGGDLTVTNNGDATVVLGDVLNIGGDLAVTSTGSGTFDASLCASGSTDIDGIGYAAVVATTAATGTTSVTSTDDSAFGVTLQPGTFSGCVNFSLTRVMVSPEQGTDAEGNVVQVDPVDAYQVQFDVPTLGIPATLTFDIVMANLIPARQIEVLEALNTGLLTLVTKSGDVGATFQTYAICASAEQPTSGGCIAIATLDTDGNPTSGSPAVVRFTGVTGHFSTWAVAILRPLSAVIFNGLLQPYPAPPAATTPSFKRGRVVPLKFNWTDANGVVIDSATASPGLAVYRGSCADQPATTDPIAAEDAGQSHGWRYDVETSTWIFGWDTKPLAAGCYWIQVTTRTAGFPPPAAMFPAKLVDK